MTIRWGLVTAVLAVMAVGAKELNGQGLVGVNLGAGPTVATGDDRGTGFHAVGGVSIRPPLLPVGFRAEGMWQRIPEGDDRHNYLGGTLNAELPIPMAVVRPYLIGGVGLYRHEEDHGDHSHDPHTDVGFNVGLGARLGLGGVNAYVEARYHRTRADDDDHGPGGNGTNSFVPLTFGISF